MSTTIFAVRAEAEAAALLVERAKRGTEMARAAVEAAKQALENAKQLEGTVKARFEDVLNQAEEAGFARRVIRRIAEDGLAMLVTEGLVDPTPLDAAELNAPVADAVAPKVRQTRTRRAVEALPVGTEVLSAESEVAHSPSADETTEAREGETHASVAHEEHHESHHEELPAAQLAEAPAPVVESLPAVEPELTQVEATTHVEAPSSEAHVAEVASVVETAQETPAPVEPVAAAPASAAPVVEAKKPVMPVYMRKPPMAVPGFGTAAKS